jgi:hypothetical protein
MKDHIPPDIDLELSSVEHGPPSVHDIVHGEQLQTSPDALLLREEPHVGLWAPFLRGWVRPRMVRGRLLSFSHPRSLRRRIVELDAPLIPSGRECASCLPPTARRRPPRCFSRPPARSQRASISSTRPTSAAAPRTRQANASGAGPMEATWTGAPTERVRKMAPAQEATARPTTTGRRPTKTVEPRAMRPQPTQAAPTLLTSMHQRPHQTPASTRGPTSAPLMRPPQRATPLMPAYGSVRASG